MLRPGYSSSGPSLVWEPKLLNRLDLKSVQEPELRKLMSGPRARVDIGFQKPAFYD